MSLYKTLVSEGPTPLLLSSDVGISWAVPGTRSNDHGSQAGLPMGRGPGGLLLAAGWKSDDGWPFR